MHETDNRTDPAPGANLATAGASQGRRLFAVVSLGGMAALMGWIALAQPMGLEGRAVLAVLALLAAGMAVRLWRATEVWLILTETALTDSHGRVLARIEHIKSVDRGVFAMKPSNGFVLRLTARPEGGTVWCPGIWWRLGRRVAVGGVLPGWQTKPMADILSIRIGERDADRRG